MPLACGLLLANRVRTQKRPVDLLILLWSAQMFAAYFTMAQFGYYFSVVVAILAAQAIWRTVEWLDIDVHADDFRTIDDPRNSGYGT